MMIIYYIIYAIEENISMFQNLKLISTRFVGKTIATVTRISGWILIPNLPDNSLYYTLTRIKNEKINSTANLANTLASKIVMTIAGKASCQFHPIRKN